MQIRAVRPRSTSVDADYVLEARLGSFTQTVAAAQALIRRGVTPSKAKSIVERLLGGERCALVVPRPDSPRRFGEAMEAIGIQAHRREAPRSIDVAALRRGLGLTQDEFAARFGLKLATVRNWEQKRATPDDAARAFLAVIARDPEVAERAVSA